MSSFIHSSSVSPVFIQQTFITTHLVPGPEPGTGAVVVGGVGVAERQVTEAQTEQ